MEDILEIETPLKIEEPAIKTPLNVPSNWDWDRSFRLHPKFGLLPSFEKCSLSLSPYTNSGNKEERKQTLRGQFPWTALLGYTGKYSPMSQRFNHVRLHHGYYIFIVSLNF